MSGAVFHVSLPSLRPHGRTCRTRHSHNLPPDSSALPVFFNDRFDSFDQEG